MHHSEETFHLRCGTIDDLSAIYTLNRLCFEEYWSLPSLYSSLESGYDLLVCEGDDTGVAAYILSLRVIDEVQIMQVAVTPSCRRFGLARRLSTHLIEQASGICSLSLEVRVSNCAALSLYKSLGFTQTGYRKKYYAPNKLGICDDASLMTLLLPTDTITT
ncbi:MAG: GNAT family N-acetyltransferase [Mariprofundus sp.]